MVIKLHKNNKILITVKNNLKKYIKFKQKNIYTIKNQEFIFKNQELLDIEKTPQRGVSHNT